MVEYEKRCLKIETANGSTANELNLHCHKNLKSGLVVQPRVSHILTELYQLKASPSSSIIFQDLFYHEVLVW